MSAGRYKEILSNKGFRSFLWAQFLGAFNDNIFKIVVSLFAIDAAAGSDGSGLYLSLASALFILPFFLFSGYAGHLSDVHNKRNVLIVTKSFEVAVMLLALFAFWSGRIEMMLGVLFMMAMQSAFFSPAKYGILPEMLPYKDLSRANGLLEMSTFLAIIMGSSLGSIVFASWKGHVEMIGFILIAIAVAGTVISLNISPVPSSGAVKPFRLNPWAEIVSGLQRLYSEKSLWNTVMGISYFWFLGALLQMDILLLGKEIMRLDDQWIGILIAFLAIGIGIGSLVAGRLSGDDIEAGLVPIGSAGMGIFSILLFYAADSYKMTAMTLIFLGFSGGLFIVPLNAYLQQKSGRQEKGRLISTNNFLNTGGILLASAAFWFLRDILDIQADRIVQIFGLFTLLVTFWLLRTLPVYLLRLIIRLFIGTFYRVRVVGHENLPEKGPALLVSNHLSFLDAFFIGSCTKRFIRFMIARSYYDISILQWFFRLMKAVPVSVRSRKDIIESIDQMREELRKGNIVCIFAEGSISRTGNMLPFKRGFEKIVRGLDVPLIPVHLDRVWGSIFSFSSGCFFWKKPQAVPYDITISFGQPMRGEVKAWQVRQSVMELGAEAAMYRRRPDDLLHLRFMKTAKQHWSSFCMADSTGQEFSYGRALAGSLLLAAWLREKGAGNKNERIGLLLPASTAAGIANIAVLMAGKIPVNLNFTAGNEGMKSAIRQGGIRIILSSNAFMEKMKFEKMEGVIFIEDALKGLSLFRKCLTMAIAFIIPYRILQRYYIYEKQSPDDIATVIFSSGSTGVPKGIMLSHHNILSNVEGFAGVFQLTGRDRLMGVLPFFHSFGYTATLWFPLLTGFGVVYHYNPMDAKTVGSMTARYKASIMLCTPTFCAAYLKNCSKEEFSSLRYVIAGAEKLREPLAASFEGKYGIRILEGYGCTEMGPVVSVNIPDAENGEVRQVGFKRGTVGHPIPGVAAKIADPETLAPLPFGREGMLLVKGPGRMMGYLDHPGRSDEVLKDGWYITGDIASIDEDGFITITDRLSRFSKIGGEMVPHIRIEEAVNGLLEGSDCIVTAIADEKRGERIVVLHTSRQMTSDELWHQLCGTDMPRLWLPRKSDIYYVESLPTLGSGKIDIRKARVIAKEEKHKI